MMRYLRLCLALKSTMSAFSPSQIFKSHTTHCLCFALSFSIIHQKWQKLAHKSPYPIATSRSAVQFNSTFCVGSAPQKLLFVIREDKK
jgi:hypothetical protein